MSRSVIDYDDEYNNSFLQIAQSQQKQGIFKLRPRQSFGSDAFSLSQASDRYQVQNFRSTTAQSQFQKSLIQRKSKQQMSPFQFLNSFKPSKSIDLVSRVYSQKQPAQGVRQSKPKPFQARKQIQNMILNKGVSSFENSAMDSPVQRQNRFKDSFNHIVFNYKPKITTTIAPHPNSMSVDAQKYYTIENSHQLKKKSLSTQNKSSLINLNLQKIIFRIKKVLEQYKCREIQMLKYIAQLQNQVRRLQLS